MFYKKVDLRSRKEMINFLKNHFRYWTMSSWNLNNSYANNVKLYNLNIPDENYETASLLCLEGLDDNPFEKEYNRIRMGFYKNTNYYIGFNGHNGGYLVLYKTKKDKDGFLVHLAEAIDGYGEDFSDWFIKDIRDRVELVQAFDKACDDIRDALIECSKKYKVVEHEVLVKKVVKEIEEV